MHYFAFITRTPDRRYRADLIDLPECTVPPCAVGDLVDTVRAAVESHLGTRASALPPPTGAAQLPRRGDDHDGFWMLFDLSPVAAGFVPGLVT